jgi:O-antigen ligase
MILELGLWTVLVATAAALGGVHPWSYRWAWIVTGVLTIVACWEGRERARRDRLRSLFRRAPLLVPGLVVLAWSLVQLLSVTVAPEDTLRGVAFLSWVLTLHVLAAFVFSSTRARGRFRVFAAVWASALAILGVAQLALGSTKVYGLVVPLEPGAHIFGSFVNRNHYAAHMLLLVPLAVGLAVEAGRGYVASLRGRGAVQWLLDLQARSGLRLVYGTLAATAGVAGLLAAQSRGATLALCGGFAVATLGARGRRWVFAGVIAFVILAAGALLDPSAIVSRFTQAPREATDRLDVWKDALGRLQGRWWTGVGFNAFATGISRTTAWRLPRGATPWTTPYETSVIGPRQGYRSLPSAPGFMWYREAHNEYVQALVETGIFGLMAALAAAGLALWCCRKDPWALAGVSAVLLHAVVDFDLQIPAISALFVVVVSLGAAQTRATAVE